MHFYLGGYAMASKGYITANVYTAREVVPISGASVMVIRKNGDKDELVGFRLTDMDGKTEIIEVDTPDSALSMEPGNGEPFSVFNIMIEHPMYYPVLVRDAQVFGGQITQQNVEMIPIADNPSPPKNNIEDITVTPQNL